MKENTKSNLLSLESAESVLGAMVRSVSTDGSCAGSWTHEITPVVSHCGVRTDGARRVLQVNNVWLHELAAGGDLEMLADEMRTWCAIHDETVRRPRCRRRTGRFAA